MTLTFFVPGKPQSQGSKVKGRYGNIREENKELGPWRERIALAAYEATGRDRHGRGINLHDGCEGRSYETLMDGPIWMDLEFILYRPKSLPKTKPTPPACKAPDADKLARAVLDALTGVVYNDDCQVVDLAIHKRVAELNEQMGVRIVVKEGP